MKERGMKFCKHCGVKVENRNVTGYCRKCYRADGSVVTKKRTVKNQPCLLCKKPQSEHQHMYCDECRQRLSTEGGWHWGHMTNHSLNLNAQGMRMGDVGHIKYI